MTRKCASKDGFIILQVHTSYVILTYVHFLFFFFYYNLTVLASDILHLNTFCRNEFCLSTDNKGLDGRSELKYTVFILCTRSLF